MVLAETCRVETAQVKQDTVFNTGEIDILLMAATAGCKLASQGGNNLETKSDIGGRVSLKKEAMLTIIAFFIYGRNGVSSASLPLGEATVNYSGRKSIVQNKKKKRVSLDRTCFSVGCAMIAFPQSCRYNTAPIH